MSLNRWGKRRDLAEPAVVAALRDAGASVVFLSESGAPDLLVGYLDPRDGSRRAVLMEVKTLGRKQAKDGYWRTTDGSKEHPETRAKQIAWAERWRGPEVVVVFTPAEALRAIGIE